MPWLVDLQYVQSTVNQGLCFILMVFFRLIFLCVEAEAPYVIIAYLSPAAPLVMSLSLLLLFGFLSSRSERGPPAPLQGPSLGLETSTFISPKKPSLCLGPS